MANYEIQSLILTLATKMNLFFSEFGTKDFKFECAKPHSKRDDDDKQKLVKKAFRIYKKNEFKELPDELTEREKDKVLQKCWDRFSEFEKLKFLQSGKILDKKPKKKKEDQDDDDVFKPGVDV